MATFVYTRKNFPDAQKLSGLQCRRADEVFGTLSKAITSFTYSRALFISRVFRAQRAQWVLRVLGVLWVLWAQRAQQPKWVVRHGGPDMEGKENGQ